MTKISPIVLDDFIPGNALNWRIVNDGVMGGLSSSQMEVMSDSMAKFSGVVSLENYGGFASTRAFLADPLKVDYKELIIRVKGDGKKYSFRARVDGRFDGVSFKQDFETQNQIWSEITLPIENFIPTWRGRRLTNIPPLKTTQIQQIGIMIADKQVGEFELIIDWIKLQ